MQKTRPHLTVTFLTKTEYQKVARGARLHKTTMTRYLIDSALQKTEARLIREATEQAILGEPAVSQ